MLVLIGGYRAAIARLRFDPADGRLAPLDEVPAPPDASFLAVSPDGSRLYAVSEVERGAVAAYALDGERAPRPLGSATTGGSGPCHLAVHPTGRWLLIANYRSGDVAVLPTTSSGVGTPTAVVAVGANVHMALPHADGELVLAPCRGTDHVAVLRLDAACGSLRVDATIALPRGTGPRHVAWRPDGAGAYLLGEDSSTLVALRARAGSFAVAASTSTLPVAEPARANAAAHVAVHPSGRWAYASNRGHDSIAVFELGADGTVRAIAHARGVRRPRHFAIDPSGRWLLAADQDGGDIAVFAIGDDGRLAPHGSAPGGDAPTCVVFA